MSARRCDYCGVFEGYQHSANCNRYPADAMTLESKSDSAQEYKRNAEEQETGQYTKIAPPPLVLVTPLPKEVEQYATEIARFVEAMVYKLKVHSKKGKWENQTIESRLPFLEGEIEELREAIQTGNMVEIMLEAADVANYALIIAAKGMEK